jgi:hypothetical protein
MMQFLGYPVGYLRRATRQAATLCNVDYTPFLAEASLHQTPHNILFLIEEKIKQKQTPGYLVHKRNIPTEQQPVFGEVRAKFCS